MKLNDEIHINSSREEVFTALNNTEILRKSIPGCEKIKRISEAELEVVVVAKIGPIKAKFNGQVSISDLNPPESYTITGEGSGGAAGFAKGGAKVFLEENGMATILRYEVQAEVGGKIAQLGGRLIDGAAKKLAGEFFNNFLTAVTVQELVKEDLTNDASTNNGKGTRTSRPPVLVYLGIISIVILYFLLENL
jgi:carbon monoxide dehydrogenase subunit G